MKCPICGNTLVPGKKDPTCLLCHNCRKKFRVRAKKGKTPESPQAAEAPKTAKTAPQKASSRPVFDGTNQATPDEAPDDRTRVFSRQEVQAALKETEAEMKRKKKAARAAQAAAEEDSDDDDDVEFHLRYANIPPKAVREKQEREMRKAYDELLSIGEEEREQKQKRHGFFRRHKK